MFSAKRLIGVISIIAATSILLVASFFNNKPEPVLAGKLSNLAVSVADKTKSATTTWTFRVTNETEIPAYSGKINIQMKSPSGSNSTNINFNGASLANTSSPSSLYLYSTGWNGLTISATQKIPANTNISIVVNGVVNGSQGGYHIAHAWTSNYSSDLDGTGCWSCDFNSAYVEIGSNTNLIGTITDADGKPIDNANINISTSDWSKYYNTNTDPNGVYGIGDIPAGTYSFDFNYWTGNENGKVYFSPPRSSLTIAESGVTTKKGSFLAATKKLTGKITKDSATGAAVTNGTVYVYKTGGNGWANIKTNSAGEYSLILTGGTWTVGVYSNNWPSDWIYPNYNDTVSFTDDATTENKTKNIIVESIDSTITGSVQYPDGSKPPQYSVSIGFNNTKNQYFSAQMNADSTFTAMVTEGTYSISGWVSNNQYSFPKVANLSIAKAQTKALDKITLVEKKDQITGTVSDTDGKPVSGASVSAWKNDNNSNDYGSTTTASDGTYRIPAIAGIWSVSSWPQWNSGYVYSGKPENITVTSGVPAVKNFTYQRATNTLKIAVTDPDGNVLSSLNAWVSAGDGSQGWGNIGGPITNGVGELKLPKGTWDVRASIYNTDYSSPDTAQVTLAGDNETKSLTMKASKNSSTIQGTIYDDAGNKVTGKWISVWATKGKLGSWVNATVNQEKATYLMHVSAGTWNLGYWIDANLGYSSGNGQEYEVAVAENETKTYDIILKTADARIGGKATLNGNPVQLAWITADTRDPKEKKAAETYYFSNGASSNASGDYELKVPGGKDGTTYYVGGNSWNYINPTRQKVTVRSGETATVNLAFTLADSTISGTVSLNGTGTNSYVTAWSEKGGDAEANSNNQGEFSLSTSKGTIWHVKAKKHVDKEIYKSDEVLVDLTNADGKTGLALTLAKQNVTLPNGQALTFNPTQQQTVTLGDGFTVSIPANALGTSGSITLTAEPTTNVAEEIDAKPVTGYGYDLQAVDDSGKAKTTFKANVTLEAKYTDAILQDAKVSDAKELNVAYYDTTAGTWQELTDCSTSGSTAVSTLAELTLNAESQKSVTCQTNHFTKFALVAATDTIPPSAPTNVTATAGNEKVTLSWTNPTENDFSAVNVYRSTTSGQLGTKIASSVSGKTYESTGLTNDTTYYYTVRSIDKSSNESVNTAQVSATPSANPATSSSDSSSSSTLPKVGYDAAQAAQEQSAALYGFLILGALMFGLELSRFRTL